MKVQYIKVPGRRKKEETERPVGDLATRKLLRAYLNGALKLSSGKSKAEAKEAIQEYHRQADTQALKASPDALKVIEEKEKNLKDRAASYGLREKINYASDADVADLSDVVSMGVGAVATSMLAPVTAADPQVLSATILAAAATYTVGRATKAVAAELSASKTPDQKRQARDYASVKHAQLALKLLKKEIEAPLKAAEKEKYKEEIANLFAAGYGQPSGGLVQKPMTAESTASGDAAPKAESAKEGKKSYWQEVKEVYAQFGNPSGGMVHNDLPAKDGKSQENKSIENLSMKFDPKDVHINVSEEIKEKAVRYAEAARVAEKMKGFLEQVDKKNAQEKQKGSQFVFDMSPAEEKKEESIVDQVNKEMAAQKKRAGMSFEDKWGFSSTNPTEEKKEPSFFDQIGKEMAEEKRKGRPSVFDKKPVENKAPASSDAAKKQETVNTAVLRSRTGGR